MINIINTRFIFIALFLYISSIYSQSDASVSSIIPLQFTSVSKPILHLGVVQEKNDMRLISGLQFQPTNNLFIGGVLSPKTNDVDLSIYYHMIIGYIPQWKLLNLSSNMFQIGMHRNRFKGDKDERWFSFSIMESVQFCSLILNLSWNHFFTQDWDGDTALISSDIKLNNSIHLRPGILAYFTPNVDYIPVLFVSIYL